MYEMYCFKVFTRHVNYPASVTSAAAVPYRYRLLAYARTMAAAIVTCNTYVVLVVYNMFIISRD